MVVLHPLDKKKKEREEKKKKSPHFQSEIVQIYTPLSLISSWIRFSHNYFLSSIIMWNNDKECAGACMIILSIFHHKNNFSDVHLMFQSSFVFN